MNDFMNTKNFIFNLNLSVLIVDVQKNIIYLNRFLEDTIKIKSSKLMNKNYEIILKQSSNTHTNPILNSIHKQKPCHLYNYILKDINKKNIIVDITSIPISKKKSLLFIIPHNCNVDNIEDECTESLSKFGLIGESGCMNEVSYLIKTVSATDATVLILGETGTGKEVVAKTVHKLSKRANEIYKVINCATISENLLENELFGHEKGSYTGAVDSYKGLFEVVSEGTIFLDEIGEISPNFQAKLLRTLETGEFNRIGSVKTKKTNARIIAASNKNLKLMVENNKFRKDLFYRLNLFPIKLPPLKNRLQDIPLLIKHFINDFNQKYNKEKTGISDVALTLLFSYDFPGNVRELRNIIEHSYIKSNLIRIEDYDFPNYLLEEMNIKKKTSYNESIESQIIYLMEKFEGNKTKVAKSLSISRKTLYEKLKKIDYDFKI